MKIKDILPVTKPTRVYNLETSTNNYIVNGFLVHNCDHQDSISERDAGWIQLYVESAQEAFDTVIQAYKIAENKNVLLPAMVCLDGYSLSHVYEPVDILEQKKVDSFLPAYKPVHAYLNPEKPITQGPIGPPKYFMGFKKASQEAMEKAVAVIKETNRQFNKKFRRSYGDGLIESYRMKDAEYAVALMGSSCGTARVAIDEMRKQGKKIGMLKIRCYRPFPKDEILKATRNLKVVAVIDRDISLGYDGALFTDIKAALPKTKVSGFIAGLGGKDITKELIKKAVSKAGKTKKQEWLE